jgi:hypothetical protein
LGTPGRGSHEAAVARAADLRPGVYWLRLVQAGQHADSKVILF